MEIKANQMTSLCTNLMALMGTFYESLYTQLFDEEAFYYSDGPDLPHLQKNQVYSCNHTLCEDAKQWDY
eukprot:3859299-Prorocentrum_lima.AAC.1